MLRNSSPDAFESLQAIRAALEGVEAPAAATRQMPPARNAMNTTQPRTQTAASPSPSPQRTDEKTRARMHVAFRSASRARPSSPLAFASIDKPSPAASEAPPPSSSSFPEVLAAAPLPDSPGSLATRTWASSAKLTKTQKLAIGRVQGSVQRGSTGLPATQVRDAMVRAVASLPMEPLSLEMMRAALRRELAVSFAAEAVEHAANVVVRVINATLLAELSPLVRTRIATPAPRPMQTVPIVTPKATKRNPSPVTERPTSSLPTPPIPVPRHEPETKRLLDVPVTTVTVSPTLVISDPQAALHLLQNTDLVKDFGTVLDTLTTVLQALHSGGQSHVTRLFLDAIENRFALVVPTVTSEKSRRTFRPPATALKDVQRLPTTHGLVIQERGAELSAWNISPQHGEVTSVKISELQRYLRNGTPPRFTHEVTGPWKTTRGQSMRDLACFTELLRKHDGGIYPLFVDAHGNTQREWTDRQLRRIGKKEPHRVREHLRRLHSGQIVTVSRHTRGGTQQWVEARMRIRLL